MLQPFPTHASINNELQDPRINATVYDEAKRLYEIRKPPEGMAMASNYHMRECLQIAICKYQERKTITQNRSNSAA